MVYDDAEKLYSEVSKDGQVLLEDAFNALLPQTAPLSAASSFKSLGEIIGYNTTLFPRQDVVEVPLVGASHLKSKVVQASQDGKIGYALLDCSGGGHISRSSGLFANCTPPSGMFFVARSVADHLYQAQSSRTALITLSCGTRACS